MEKLPLQLMNVQIVQIDIPEKLAKLSPSILKIYH